MLALVESVSGVRGIWGKDLTEGIVRRYALAYESFLREKAGFTPAIVIGFDSRPSSKAIKCQLEDCLGCNVEDIGIAPTPAIEHAVRHQRADGGIIITGSHNPKECNGLKFLRQDGGLLSAEDMKEIVRRVHREDPLEAYISSLLGLFEPGALQKVKEYYSNGRKIILDPNGGAGCLALDMLVKKLGVNYEILNCRLGQFRRRIEPNRDSLSSLAALLDRDDIAFGFDCDADRAEVVIPAGSGYAAEFGNVVSGQYILGVIADYVLGKLGKDANGRYVVVNDATSYLVKKIAERHGAIFEEVGTGEINVVDRMIARNAVIGGEGSSSGPIVNGLRCRDGALTMLYILAITAEQGRPLGAIIDSPAFPKYCTLRDDNQVCEPRIARAVSDYLRRHYQSRGYAILCPDEFSAIKAVDRHGSWVYFRASLTEGSKFRIISDSGSRSTAENLLQEGRRAFAAAKKSAARR